MKKERYDKIKRRAEEEGVLVRLSLRELETLAMVLLKGRKPLLESITGDEDMKEWDLRLANISSRVEDARHLISLRVQSGFLSERLATESEAEAAAVRRSSIAEQI